MGGSLHVEPALVDRMQEYNVCQSVCVCMYVGYTTYMQYMLLVENGT
jgi:hypothetical protein